MWPFRFQLSVTKAETTKRNQISEMKYGRSKAKSWNRRNNSQLSEIKLLWQFKSWKLKSRRNNQLSEIKFLCPMVALLSFAISVLRSLASTQWHRSLVISLMPGDDSLQTDCSGVLKTSNTSIVYKCNYLHGCFPLLPFCFCIHYALLL